MLTITVHLPTRPNHQVTVACSCSSGPRECADEEVLRTCGMTGGLVAGVINPDVLAFIRSA